MHSNTQIHNPHDPFQQAFNLHQAGRLHDAEIQYKNILKHYPSHVGSMTMLGTLLIQTKRNEEGIEVLTSSLKKDPNQFFALNSIGAGLLNINKYSEAKLNFDRAIALNPNYVDAHFNQGKSLRLLKKYQEAILSYTKCIELNNCYADAFNNRGNIYLEELKKYEEALADYHQFIQLMPNSFLGYYNLGNVLKDLHQYDEALTNYDNAIRLNPNYAEAYYNRGVVLEELKQYDCALTNYNNAIVLNPNYAEAYCNLGCIFLYLRKYDDALQCFGRAIELRPDYADAHFNRGSIFQNLKKFDDALACYDSAIALKPDVDFLYGNRLHTQMFLCDWENLEYFTSIAIRMITDEKRVSVPFVMISLTDDLKIQQKCAEIYANKKFPPYAPLQDITEYPKHDKIRIGYFSADFRIHPVSYLMAELFEIHNREKFEIIAFAFGPDTNDAVRKKLISSFDKFIDVNHMSDLEVIKLSRELEVDIAIDLGGFTGDSRTGIFAGRAAPIQVNYLGYPGTMGTTYMDYLIADKTLIPTDLQQYYSEKIVYLPNSYMVNNTQTVISKRIFTRNDVEFPVTGFVFCCFNNTYKITPVTFDTWMRILKQVDGSVLWLSGANNNAVKNLRKEAEKKGVDGNRLIFASFMPNVEDHLARLQLADLFLDTLPYNAHTTASDALRVGLPVLTCVGEAFASRVAASLLNAIGLSELITTNQEEYEALAIELATTKKLASIKEKLINNYPTHPLYNTKLFTQHIESAFIEMYERYHSGSTVNHIYVKA